MKFKCIKIIDNVIFVTLYVRVWIEMLVNVCKELFNVVTLYVRVWIEMS